MLSNPLPESAHPQSENETAEPPEGMSATRQGAGKLSQDQLFHRLTP